ncbi:succinate dehydrogenase cytochrome b small subunit [Colletotrichum tofieldiae]|uniref:Succinate dehydrogenase [ubiquinone] cytochrome b small subunit n=1 Tax=Colletotrichum liriopes TaxID=708192 RepID=A0AA37LUU2_9PEZI|nr:succinate dehydrogenase [ubiquinone] cytochrome b small subunit, mitochondrial [Colletotrichum liriopes]GKT64574.1 succinate dehydrogenase cytochrome b small subunit [Colletotrichum tofieldiae]GKT74544.1 succinate dehydrogenase cytochrome b small subunit [Colletotrichum tofieldiae]GKT91728.1 succinate dehydrogenase cytochrome b small subunit [Colletotrichum tofieldiae]
MASIVRPSLLRQTAMAARMAQAAPIRSAFVKNSTRAAAFHTTAKRELLPVGPLNKPAPVPPPSPAHGSYHWTFDRLLAAGLVPITIAPFAAGSLNPTTDAILCAMILIHSHTGFQNIIIDYVPTKHYPKSRKATMWGLNLATALVGLGLYEFETSDVGVTEAVARLWRA